MKLWYGIEWEYGNGMKNTKGKYLPYCHPPKRNYQKEILRKKVCKEKKNEKKKDILSV